jgi:glucokinase
VLLKKAESMDAAVTGIGVGFGGTVESETGRANSSRHVEGWGGFDLKKWCEDKFGLPTVVANDTSAGGWAEYLLGSGRGTENFFYMNIGSGIGGALISEGRLLDGQGLGAGEIGHTHVPDWTSDTPGAVAILESLCSGWAIERRVRKWPSPPAGAPLAELCGGNPEAIDCRILAEAAEAGDALARDEIERIAESLGIALANVIALFHPERIALGGGVALMGETLLEPIRRSADRYCFDPFRGIYSIVPCELGESVVTTGALLLAPHYSERIPPR